MSYQSTITKTVGTVGAADFRHMVLIVNRSASTLRCPMLDHKNIRNYRKIMRGYQPVSIEEYTYLQESGRAAEKLRSEISMIRKAREKQQAKMVSLDIKYKNQINQLKTLQAAIAKAQKDLEAKITELRKAEQAYKDARRKAIEEVNTADFLRIVAIYSKMAPENAAATMLDNEDDERIAKILSQMKERTAAKVADALFARETELIAEAAQPVKRRLPDIMNLVKDYRGAPEENE